MGAQPVPQERTKPFHGMDMDCTKAVSLFISGVLSPSMVDTLIMAFMVSNNRSFVTFHFSR